nr:M1 family peptidase [Saprospiraceae bacterium]
MKYRYYSFALLYSLLHLAGPAYADKYPRNFNIDILHYKFELTLSDATDEIRGTASITVLFKKNDLLDFRLDFANKTPARIKNGMEVESITQNGEPIKYTHKNDALIIQLAKPSVSGTPLTFVIRYHGIAADALRIGPTKHGDRSFFTENWPNRTRHWLPCIDHPYEKATCEFLIKAPSHYQVISNGLLMEETDLDSTTRLTHWKQGIPVSSWLYVLGVAHFAVQYVDEVYG